MSNINNLPLKDGYFIHNIDAKFTIKKAFYFFHIPIPMSIYESLKNTFKKQGKAIDLSIGMIEASKLFGIGYIGLNDTKDGNVYLKKDFIAYKMIGDYKQFKSSWKKIMSDYPKITEAYHLYMTDPTVVKPEENITYIIFR